MHFKKPQNNFLAQDTIYAGTQSIKSATIAIIMLPEFCNFINTETQSHGHSSTFSGFVWANQNI